MKTFAQHITEVFTTPAKWRVAHSSVDVWEAQFSIDDMDYFCHFISYSNPPSIYSLEFGIAPETLIRKNMHQTRFKVSDTGHAFQVFATVYDALLHFIKEREPMRVDFEADEHEPSRVKLYNHFVKAMNIPGYKAVKSGPNEYWINRMIPRTIKAKPNSW